MSEDKYGLKGRTALITGSGGGLGRAHALLFAEHGANVVVNDLGGARDGTGSGTNMADQVVDEIKAAGGSAVANYDSVSDADGAQNMIKTAVDAFGSIDIVVNNAGILRDISFTKCTDAEWDAVYAVHVKGAYNVTKAAWDTMRDQNYGRIIMTASASGIYGNFGQTNYSMAKSGLIGFGQTLAVEGEKRNIKTNIIAPIAHSRMTEELMPENVHELIRPELVSPLVVYLCSESCDANGEIYEVGAGGAWRVETLRAKGYAVKPTDGRNLSVDEIAENWAQINDMKDGEILRSIGDSTGATLKHCMS